MTLPRFAVGQCDYMDEEYQCSQKLQFWHYYLSLFLQVALSPNLPLRVLWVHINSIRGITIHITESKIHITYSENHDSTLFFYYFYMSPLPTLTHIITKGSSFSISSPFGITKLQKKLSWCIIDWELSILNVNGNAYSYPLPSLLWFKRERVFISVFPKTMVSRVL